MNSKEQSEYLLNKAWIWEKLKHRKFDMEQICSLDSVGHNVISDEELRLMQAVCYMILADFEYEDQTLKTPPQNLN